MPETNETYEEQVLRVLKEMVLSGEVLAEERDGELYFTLNDTPTE
jgi:hypothetical protein